MAGGQDWILVFAELRQTPSDYRDGAACDDRYKEVCHGSAGGHLRELRDQDVDTKAERKALGCPVRLSGARTEPHLCQEATDCGFVLWWHLGHRSCFQRRG